MCTPCPDGNAKTSSEKPPLQRIMYELLYPGVLGSGIVLGIVRATHFDSLAQMAVDPSLWIDLCACLFYTVSFVSSDGPENKKDLVFAYGWQAFFVDVLESGLMFFCFNRLRLFDEPSDYIWHHPAVTCAYSLLALDVIAVQPLWRKIVRMNAYDPVVLRLSVFLLMIAGMLFALFCKQGSVATNIIVSISVCLCVLFYALTDDRYFVDQKTRDRVRTWLPRIDH